MTRTVLCTAHMLTNLSQQHGEVGALLPPFPDVEPKGQNPRNLSKAKPGFKVWLSDY